jgi:Na+-translocating ferredoxin:NAD+ oxidoreductase RnfC subunit
MDLKIVKIQDDNSTKLIIIGIRNKKVYLYQAIAASVSDSDDGHLHRIDLVSPSLEESV